MVGIGRVKVKTGNAPIEQKISAYPPKRHRVVSDDQSCCYDWTLVEQSEVPSGRSLHGAPNLFISNLQRAQRYRYCAGCGDGGDCSDFADFAGLPGLAGGADSVCTEAGSGGGGM